MGRAIRCSNDMADRMETDKDIREMSLFDYFFFFFMQKLILGMRYSSPQTSKPRNFFIIKLFVTRNSDME